MNSVCGEDEYSDMDNPLHLAMAQELRRRLDVALLHLGLRSRAIIFWYFGLLGPSKTLSQIGDELNITSERVRQILHKTMKELRSLRPLREYGEISEHTFEAMRGIDVPRMTLFTATGKVKSERVLPERITGFEYFLHLCAVTIKAESEL